MNKIIKCIETMSSRERVLRTFEKLPTDRVPISYSSNPTIHNKFANYIGINPEHHEEFLTALGVDYRGVMPRFTGEVNFKQLEGRQVHPYYGFYTKWVENEHGGYFDFCNFPLQSAEPDAIRNFHVPSFLEFDYDSAVAEIELHHSKGLAVHIGDAGVADIINATGRVMNMEDTLVNLMEEDTATLEYIGKRVAMEIGILKTLLERAADKIDFVWIGEDLGTQYTPMISLELYRKVLKPFHKKYIDLAKTYNKPVMVHSCGSSSWVYDDFIEMGVTCVDTLQPEATNMSPDYLAKRYGDKLCFQGCISTAGPLAYGSTDDVEKNVRETLEIMMKVKGYFFAPTHAIQDNTPPENIFTMYQCAHKYGMYKGN